MKVTRLTISNFRSIERLDISFPSYYAAISGKNNSGKTNLVRAIRSLLPEEDFGPFQDEEEEVNYKRDFPSWKTGASGKEPIHVAIELEVDSARDAGLYKYITEFLQEHVQTGANSISLTVEGTYTEKAQEKLNTVTINGTAVSDKFKQQELIKRLRSAHFVYYHNSTESNWQSYPRGSTVGRLTEFTPDDRSHLEKEKVKINKVLGAAAKTHQRDLTTILGKLSERYDVGLSFPTFDLTYLPYNITLGDKNQKIPLKDWGSGTQNRTKILSTLLKSKHVIDGAEESDRITPIIIIEEPESFLHPSAQGEFGRVLQDISEEFQVQVITTTHSPYMLSLRTPTSNVLLRRDIEPKTKLIRGTCHVATGGDEWMRPFGESLGINAAEFAPWGDLFFKNADRILLVEGATDEKYLELLRSADHGSNRLLFDGEIYAYGGYANINNQVLLSFMQRRYRSVIVTSDLDSAEQLRKTMTSLGITEGKTYFPIGLNEDGRKDIEGLLPDSVKSKVYAENPGLVDAARGTQKERKDARQKLKQLLFDAFKAVQSPGTEFYGEFYKLARRLNKALNTQK